MPGEEDGGIQSLAERFPSLRALGQKLGGIPYVQQHTMNECGLACLAMTLRYHGRATSLDEMRAVLPVDREGVSAKRLLDSARLFGLRARGVQVEVEDLQFLDPGSILHWDLNHYVVFEGFHRDHITIVDPGTGRRRVPMAQVRKSLSGVALLLEPGERLAPSSVEESPWRIVGRLVSSSGTFARLLIASFLLQMLALFVPAFTTVLVDRILPRADRDLFLLFMGGAATLIVFHGASGFIREHLLIYLRVRLSLGLKLEFMDRLLRLPYAFFLTRSSGDLVERLQSTSHVQNALSSTVVAAVLDALFILLNLLFLMLAAPQAGLLVLSVGLIQAGLLGLLLRARGRMLDAEVALQSKASAVATEMLFGIESAKSMGMESRLLQQWSARFVELVNAQIRRGRLEAGANSVLHAIQFGSPLIVLVYGASAVLSGEMTLGLMLGLFALSVGFLTPLASLIAAISSLGQVRAHLGRIQDVLAAAPEQEVGKGRPPPELKGAVELDRVSFRYGPLSREVVKEVSVRVEPGQFVALVGRSGSGKTSLARLLIGLNVPSDGTILFDGIDMREYDLSLLRQQCGIVTQRPFLFQQTILANISGGDPAISREDVFRAAQAACVHDDILSIPAGYATFLSEGGSSISGGQAQRVALARALVRRPKLLVLDEATSALDSVTERAIQENLANLSCTRIVIAHRLSTIRDADLILVMDDGRIVESGRHAALLEKQGYYAKLVEAQLAAEG